MALSENIMEWSWLVMDIAKLGEAGQWAEVRRRGRTCLEREGWNMDAVCSVGMWVAVADLWEGSEPSLQEAERLSNVSLQADEVDGSIMTVRACVLMARGNIVEAETMMRLGGKRKPSGPAVKVLAHL
jgi:hypothetical protein